jgi:lycopene beta-cyclase
MGPYEFIFAGGGLAGLSLASRLVHSPLGDCPILIIDRESKTRNDRTWCFWNAQPTLFDDIARHSWRRIHFVGEGFQGEIHLGDYRYQMIRGIDFYRFARQGLSAYPNVKFLQGTVEIIEDGEDYARVWVEGEAHAGRWVFDSRFDLKAFNPDPARFFSLRQYFRGWEIETPPAAFNPHVATLLDFRTPQMNAMRFFYVLPFSDHRALVEYVSLGQDQYDQALKAYVEEVLGIGNYHIVSTEGGVNPMSDYPFPRRAGKRLLNIGVRGGRLKPSTGYAFRRIQLDSAAIVESLIRRGHPFDVPSDSGHYRLLDSLMLDVMQKHGDQIKPIFTQLFKNNPISRVLRLLDDESSLVDIAFLMTSVPPRLFLQALGRMICRSGGVRSDLRMVK